MSGRGFRSQTYSNSANRNNYGSRNDSNKNFGENPAGNGSANGNFRRNNPNRQFNSTPGETMEVPSQYVGRIIGKGGTKISDLQFESGAKIHVTKDIVGENTIIRLSGSTDEIERARLLIQDLTVERKPRESQPPLDFAPSDAQTLSEEQKHREQRIQELNTLDWKTINERHEKFVQEKLASLPKIEKCFYQEVEEVAQMSAEEVEEFRENSNNIMVSRVFVEKFGDKPIPNPVRNFSEAFHNYPLIMAEIEKAGFEKPSPIQSQAWPVLLQGEDLIGIAQTGTGKTLAFLLPALIHIDGQTMPKKTTEPRVLIMAPTRELALQIEREVNKYNYKDIKSVCVYGGGDKQQQINAINEGVDIVIATPGRLNDLVLAKKLSMEGVTYVVLDEADKMLDMGFEPQIRKTLYNVREDRQTVMTSATWPEGVRRLANSYMVNPIQIYVGSLDLAAVHTVTQVIQMMPNNDEAKFETFMDFVQTMNPEEKAIVFCGKKARADYLTTELAMKGVYCASLHGDREQCDREQALEDITSGYVKILIATDLASRGIDIEDITYVINYDFPRNIEEYVHRVGRTGRAGRSGQSITYFTRDDWSHAEELIPILEKANQFVPEELVQMKERFAAWKQRRNDRPRGGGGGRGGYGGRRGGSGGNYGIFSN